MTRETRRLPIPLNDHEVAQREHDARLAREQMRAAERDFNDIKARHKLAITELEERIELLDQEAGSRSTMGPVQVHASIVGRRREVMRMDTGEVIESRFATPEEVQASAQLTIDEARTPKKSPRRSGVEA